MLGSETVWKLHGPSLEGQHHSHSHLDTLPHTVLSAKESITCNSVSLYDTQRGAAIPHRESANSCAMLSFVAIIYIRHAVNSAQTANCLACGYTFRSGSKYSLCYVTSCITHSTCTAAIPSATYPVLLRNIHSPVRWSIIHDMNHTNIITSNT